MIRLSLPSPRLRYAWERVGYMVTEALFTARARLAWGINHVCGPRQIPLNSNEMVVLCLVRNGTPWLPTFIRHYQELGAKHIVFLDNNSTDDTVARAAAHENVSIFATSLPYARYQVAFKRWLVKRFAQGGWGLCCDVDELFEYPFSEVVPLKSFLEYLNQNGYTAVVAQMLDMFSAESLSDIQGRVDEDLTRMYPFYDISHVARQENPNWLQTNRADSDDLSLFKGGVRARVFGTKWATLTKHPLIRGDGTVCPFASGPHFATHARLADVTAVLRHYKFVGAFEQHTEEGVRQGQYYRGSRTYRHYHDVFTADPNLSLYASTAREYRSPEELLSSGFLVASDRYLEWARGLRKDAGDR